MQLKFYKVDKLLHQPAPHQNKNVQRKILRDLNHVVDHDASWPFPVHSRFRRPFPFPGKFMHRLQLSRFGGPFPFPSQLHPGAIRFHSKIHPPISRRHPRTFPSLPFPHQSILKDDRAICTNHFTYPGRLRLSQIVGRLN